MRGIRRAAIPLVGLFSQSLYKPFTSPYRKLLQKESKTLEGGLPMRGIRKAATPCVGSISPPDPSCASPTSPFTIPFAISLQALTEAFYKRSLKHCEGALTRGIRRAAIPFVGLHKPF